MLAQNLTLLFSGYTLSELAVDDLISVARAIEILDAVRVDPRIVRVPLIDSLNLHLAEDIHADRDYPPFDKALMDGYAIRAGGENYTVIQTIAAGQVADRPIVEGQAMAIMTGAPLPVGADAVVPIEWAGREENVVTVNRSVKAGNAIARRGSDSAVGTLLLGRGTTIGPAQIAVLATVGRSVVSVYAAPVVALLATGNEIVAVDQVPVGSQIRNANGPMLGALLTRLGCVVKDLGVVRDDPGQIEAAIEMGLNADALFITGGMSMGEHDYVPGLLRKLRLELRISKLKIKPGKPFVFATGRSIVFGLPGNPVSGYVCTLVLANRILARMRGGIVAKPGGGQLSESMPANGDREFYIPAVISDGKLRPLRPNGSADLGTLAAANCLIIRPENARMANSGDWGCGYISCIICLDFTIRGDKLSLQFDMREGDATSRRSLLTGPSMRCA